MEDYKVEEDNIDRQEDQQARSSENQQIGGSSGANADLSSGGQMQRKSQFQPVIVNYEDISKNSMKGRVNSTRH